MERCYRDARRCYAQTLAPVRPATLMSGHATVLRRPHPPRVLLSAAVLGMPSEHDHLLALFESSQGEDVSFVRKIKNASPRWVRDSADQVTRQYGMITSRNRTTPDYLIIGSKRGGTTSLYNYLLRHPGVMRMFPSSRDLKSTDFFFRRGRSEAWYRSHFPTVSERRRRERELGYAPVVGEASPYYCWDARVAGYVRDVAPQVKSILLVREPVRRAWSHYQERVQNGVEPLGFIEALEAETERLADERTRMASDPTYYSTAFDWYGYRSRGEYMTQIENWLEHFPASQLLVLPSEELYSDTQATFDKVCTFLGLPTIEMPTRKTFNATWRTKDDVPDDARELLAPHFAEHNARLEQFLNRKLGW